MNDTMKMIDDAASRIKKTYAQFDTFGTTHAVLYSEQNESDLNIAIAALSVLQKITSGDDWFPICDAPNERVLILSSSYGEPQVYIARKFKNDIYKGSGRIFNGKLAPTHWKPLCGKTHIEMLMKKEMENNDK